MSQRLQPSPNAESYAPAPERLVSDPELGPLLERANREYKRGLDEHAAFQRLSARQEPRSSSLGVWPRATLGAALGLAAGVALVWSAFGERAPSIAFGPEVSVARVRSSAPRSPELETADDTRSPSKQSAAIGSLEPVHGDPPPAHAADTEQELEALEPPLTPSPPPRRQSVTPSQRNDVEPTTPASSKSRARVGLPKSTDDESGQSKATSAPGGLGASPAERDSVGAQNAARVNCLDSARGGDPRATESCFNRQAAGSGLSAEMALYEMARLRRDVLRDPNGALAALDEYRQRFPSGTLRNEVNISRVELLSQLGRGREALRESQALLDSSSGRERAAELHVLRGNVYRHDLADLPAAILEYERAEPFGGSLGAEASRLRGMCLESLGEVDAALAAYRRYLASPEQSRRADVQHRVEALTKSSPARGANP
jgi:hypothetical protein